MSAPLKYTIEELLAIGDEVPAWSVPSVFRIGNGETKTDFKTPEELRVYLAKTLFPGDAAAAVPADAKLPEVEAFFPDLNQFGIYTDATIRELQTIPDLVVERDRLRKRVADLKEKHNELLRQHAEDEKKMLESQQHLGLSNISEQLKEYQRERAQGREREHAQPRVQIKAPERAAKQAQAHQHAKTAPKTPERKQGGAQQRSPRVERVHIQRASNGASDSRLLQPKTSQYDKDFPALGER